MTPSRKSLSWSLVVPSAEPPASIAWLLAQVRTQSITKPGFSTYVSRKIRETTSGYTAECRGSVRCGQGMLKRDPHSSPMGQCDKSIAAGNGEKKRAGARLDRALHRRSSRVLFCEWRGGKPLQRYHVLVTFPRRFGNRDKAAVAPSHHQFRNPSRTRQ